MQNKNRRQVELKNNNIDHIISEDPNNNSTDSSKALLEEFTHISNPNYKH